MSQSQNKYSILVIDDQETNLSVLNKILSPDYTVYTVNNGRAGIEVAERVQPDIILLDVMMDEMDGYDVIEALKASEGTKSIPVIFVTSLDSTGDEAWGLSLGAVDYIIKPFSPVIVKLRVQVQIKVLEQMRTIERLLTHDPLTDLPNRRSLAHRIRSDWEKTLRNKRPFSILIINIDGFKNYNNTYGSDQGDIVLKSVANVLTGSLKSPYDFVARWGGGEFVMLLPAIEPEEALKIAENVRQGVEQLEFVTSVGLATKISVSIGMNAHLEWWDGATTDEFIKDAYLKLYKAKESGGNRVSYIFKERHNSI